MRNTRFGVAGLAMLVAVALSGCGASSGADTASAAPAEETCFTEPSATQRAELEDYMASQPDTQSVSTDGETVCVLTMVDSAYQQQYYSEQDQSHFGDYLLYSMLLGNANTLATVGLLTGDLGVGEALALSMLAGVSSTGQVTRQYTESPYGWERNPTPVSTPVKTVKFGTAAPVAFKSGLVKPAAYANPSKLPSVTTDAAAVSKSSTGTLTVTKAAPPSGWTQKYKNPSTSGGSGSGSTGTTDGSSGTSVKPPAAPKPPPAAPKPKPKRR